MSLRRLVLIGMVFASALTLPVQADWPQFRGPGGMGVSPAKGLPLTWSQKDNVVWKVELAGSGTSSPAIFGDRIYLTYFTGYSPRTRTGNIGQLKLHLTCLNRANGKTIWISDITPQLPEQERIREDHGYASSTPAVDSSGIYLFFGKSGAFCFSHEGKQLWQVNVGSRLNGWGSAASPVLHGDNVIINASVESDSLVALNKKSGKEVWKAGGIREAWNTPVLVPIPGGKTELVVPVIGRIHSLDPVTGTKLWQCTTDIGWYMVPSVVAHEGIVYSIGGRSGVVGLAVKAGGQGDVTKTHRLWKSQKGSNVSSPIYHNGHLYWMNDAQGIAYCAEAATGKVVYEERMPRSMGFYASPVLADGKLYYFDRAGKCFVLPAQPQFEVLATNELRDGAQFDSSPAVVGDRLFVRSERYLYCLGTK